MKSRNFLFIVIIFGYAGTSGFIVGFSASTCPPLTCPAPCAQSTGGPGCPVCVCTTSQSTASVAPLNNCERVFSRNGEISSYVQNKSCDYLIDLGDGFETGQKYVRLQFSELNLQVCDNCGCDYVQLPNANFHQRSCSDRDIVIGRTYKVHAENRTSRFIRLRFHTNILTSTFGFRLKYEVDWGNSTHVCEPVTCPIKCSTGLQQDFANCPMCKCASSSGKADSFLLDKVAVLNAEVKSLQTQLQLLYNTLVNKQANATDIAVDKTF